MPRFVYDVRDDGSKLPVQWEFQAGGIGTLRGHEFQQFHGDRTALATVEYSIDTGESIKTALFLDSGLAWNESRSGPQFTIPRSFCGSLAYCLM